MFTVVLFLLPLVSLGKVFKIESNEQWNSLVSGSEKAVVVEFKSDRCGSCKEFESIWHSFAEAFSYANVAQVSVDNEAGMAIAGDLGILEEGIPNVRIFGGSVSQGISVMVPDTQEEMSAESLEDEVLEVLGSDPGFFFDTNQLVFKRTSQHEDL